MKTAINFQEALTGTKPIQNARILQYIEECLETYKELGYNIDDLKHRHIVLFLEGSGFNCFGTFRWAKYSEGASQIILNKYMFNESEESVKSTIYHELAHYLVMCRLLDEKIVIYESFDEIMSTGRYKKALHGSHGLWWQSIVNKVIQKTHINITAKSNYEIHSEVGKERENKIKYKVVCTNCGNTLEYLKKSDFVKDPNAKSPETNYYKWACERCHKAGIWKVEEVNK